MSFTSLLIHTCDIGALSQGVQDDYGNPAETWPLSYTSQPCRLMSTTGREIRVGAEVVISDWKLFVDGSVNVDEQDVISDLLLASSGAVVDSATFQILLVLPKSNGVSEHHKELALQRVA